MRKICKISFLWLGLFCIQLSALAQKRTITGKVTDSKDGSPLAGATVLVKGGTSAAQTDANGNFSIVVGENDQALVISSAGYATQEISLQGKTAIDVSLVARNTTLGEVVVIGYGTARKRDLTGAIATVSSREFNKGPLVSPEQLINGKVAGVQITMPSGAPGAGGRIRVRGTSSLNGSNDPLIIIDGVPVDQQSGIAGSNNPLAMINPNDIESFNILKDASATAIYGNRATNGVIIITTKKGRAGKFRINVNNMASYSVVGKTTDVLTADEFKAVVNSKGNPSQKNLLGNENTRWQDLVYDNAFANDLSLALSGGFSFLPYRASFGYLKQNGILKTGSLNRITTAINLNPKLLDNALKIDFNFKGTFSKHAFANEGAITGAAFFDPTKPVYRNDGRFGGYWEWLQNNQPFGLAPKNPVGMLYLREDNSNVRRFITNLQLDYTLPFLKDLRAVLNVGLDHSFGEGTVYIPDSAAMTYVRGGVNNMYEQTKNNKLLDFYLNYTKDFAKIKSRLDLTAGYGYQDFIRESPNFPDYRANGTVFAPAPPFPFFAQNTLVSFYSRANFSINNKYLFTATIRRDGTSRVNPNDRWGLFPSAAFAWNIGEEGLLKNSKLISNLKLRLGYGVTGQQEIGNDYQYIPAYFAGTQTAQYQFGNNFYPVSRPQAYDANLKWETTTTYNAGLDYGFLEGRITGSLDYYFKKTKDLLSFVPVPVGTNFSNGITTNVGSMNNFGVEFLLNTNLIRQKKLNWDFGFNVTYNRNEITKLTLVDDPTFVGVQVGGISGAVGNTIQIHSVGYRPGSFFVLKQVYDNTGKPLEGVYVDQNGDNVINNLDYYRYQSPEPLWIFGFNTSVSFDRWSLSTVLRANVGNYMYNNVFSNFGVFQPGSLPFLMNIHRNYLETGFGTYQYFSDYYVENASFLRMDNISLTYDFGKVLGKTFHLRANANVQNVFVITKYRGLDPEIAGGIDNNFYPRPRIFSIGLNLDL